jgi:hypothetical protein
MNGILNLITGLVFIGAGLLVKRFPNMIAGYNNMSDENRTLVDISGLSTFLRNGLILIGAIIILCFCLMKIIGIDMFAGIMMLAAIFAGTTVLVIKAQNYYQHANRNNRIVYIILIGIFLLVTGLLFYGLIPTKTIIEGDRIRFTGEYGITLHASDIKTIELVDSIPPVRIRTNGMSMGYIHKGIFRLERWGKCSLLVNSGNAPYMVITKTTGEIIIYNGKNADETGDVFDRINRKTL